MTNWIDDVDDDLMAAPSFDDESSFEPAGADDPSDVPRDVSDQEFREQFEGDDWTPEQGFPAADGAVCLWTDEHGFPTRLRLALSWPDHVPDRLDDAVNVCVQMALSYFHRPSIQFDLDPIDDGTTMSEQSLAELLDQAARLDEQQRELAARDGGELTHWEGGGSVGYAADKKVQATIGPDGYLSKIDISEGWAHQTRVSEISRAVIEACNNAKHFFVPGELVIGEAEQLVAQQATIFRKLRGAMRAGFGQ